MTDIVQVTPADLNSENAVGGWPGRILRFPITRIVLAILVLVPVTLLHRGLVEGFLRGLDGNAVLWLRDIEKIFIIGVMIFAYQLYVRFIENRRALEVGGSGMAREFGAGFGYGAIMILITVGGILLFGDLTVTGRGPETLLVHGFIAMAFYAILEDLMFRAILFRILEEWLGTWIAIVLVAGFFGLAHLGNENASWVSSVALAVGDLSLAAAFVLTRRIWMVWGVHVGWNFTQDKLFGMANSGFSSKGNYLQTEVTGPIWATGGEFGVELSLTGTLISLLIGIYLMKKAYDAGQIVAPAWRR